MREMGNKVGLNMIYKYFIFIPFFVLCIGCQTMEIQPIVMFWVF